MVGKLIKHELHSTLRIAAIPALIMVLLAILARIMFETTSLEVAIVLLFFYIIFLMATLAIGYLFGIYSFYQSLFTPTGYLTLSLPITPDQLIWSKLISAIAVMFASIIVCLLSACIFFLGLPQEALDAIFDAFATMGEIIRQYISSEPMFFVELVLVVIISVPMSFLVFYAIMCIGQMFTVKNRKAISILLYVGLMFVWEILSTTIIADINEKMMEISYHLAMWVQIVFDAGVAVGCYFLVRYIIKNKVNLLA
ncbi:MAG: hypothetical protein K2L12_01720 [Clostridia bacterium]|nr:hypothetical protein [Clostridia bacterium]